MDSDYWYRRLIRELVTMAFIVTHCIWPQSRGKYDSETLAK
jgi:hypothetical protein